MPTSKPNGDGDSRLSGASVGQRAALALASRLPVVSKSGVGACFDAGSGLAAARGFRPMMRSSTSSGSTNEGCLLMRGASMSSGGGSAPLASLFFDRLGHGGPREDAPPAAPAAT